MAAIDPVSFINKKTSCWSYCLEHLSVSTRHSLTNTRACIKPETQKDDNKDQEWNVPCGPYRPKHANPKQGNYKLENNKLSEYYKALIISNHTTTFMSSTVLYLYF